MTYFHAFVLTLISILFIWWMIELRHSQEKTFTEQRKRRNTRAKKFDFDL